MTAHRCLSGRTALVTGASRGVGRAIALRLAAQGATVAVNYRRDADAADEVVRQIVEQGAQAAAYAASVADSGAVQTMLGAIEKELGAVDLLVSNAGIASRGSDVANTELREFRSLLDVHTLGPLALLQPLLPGMRAAGRGDVVMISSAFARSAPVRSAPYTMAKVAMEAAVITLAREERAHGIRANIVAPGVVATDMGERYVATSTGGRTLAEVEAEYPFGRMCRPEDIAGVVAFLVSPDGAYITGQRIQVDGGG
jgi:NAD(P)-dependent dehydrogenase (short-subunit alcohol dehydrogenase family)